MPTEVSEVKDPVRLSEKRIAVLPCSALKVFLHACVHQPRRLRYAVVLFPLLIGQLCLIVFLEDSILPALYTNGQFMPLSLS